MSDVATLRTVVVKTPAAAFVDDARIDREWRELGYLERPDLTRAIDEHARFVTRLHDAGAEVIELPPDASTTLDSLYARDAAVVSPRGVVLCAMGKPARETEPAAMSRVLRERGLPIVGAIEPPGKLEGGDCAFVDDVTLAVGRGYRTNDDGIAQLRALIGADVEVVTVPLPHHRGPQDVFHLMSIYSPIDVDLALVHSPLMPVPFRERLLARGMTLVEADATELDSQGCNALAIAPRRCLFPSGNPRTAASLRAAGVEVIEFAADEICRKGCGGPTCLTRPLARG